MSRPHRAARRASRNTLLSFSGGDSSCEIRDDGGHSTVRGYRIDDTLHIDTVGPALVRAVTFADVTGTVHPAVAIVNGVLARMSTVDGQLTAIVEEAL